MNKILLVDIDTGMLNIFKGMFKEHSDKVEILTSGNVREVANIISSVKVNMVIVDLKMPDMDDFEFLFFMNQNYSHIPVIVTTAFGTPDIESRIKKLESCLYFEKPIDMESLKEKIFDEMNIGVGGQIHGIALSSFLQMSEMEKTTCTLKIKTDENVGLLYLLKGELIAAETGLLSGKDAACEIVGWENAIIEIEKGTVRKKKEISMPLMNILMEALSIKDEKENAKKKKKDKKALSSKKQLEKTDSDLELEVDEETEQKPPEESAKKKSTSSDVKDVKLLSTSQNFRRKRILVSSSILFAIVILSSVGWFSWVNFIKPGMIKKKYDNVLISIGYQESMEEKYKTLKNYIENNTGSPFFLSAEKKISEIKDSIQESDFEKAIAGVENLSIDDEYNIKAKTLYNEYLERHPEGSHVEEIKKKINEIQKTIDERRFKDLQKIPSDDYKKRLAAYNEYLSEQPEGKYRKDVKKLKEKQSEIHYKFVKEEIIDCERNKDLAPCIDLCSKFIIDYKESAQVPKIKALMLSMQSRQTMATLKRKVEDERLESKAARKVYIEYLKKNPKAPAEKSIRVVLAKLDQKIKDREAWDKIVAYSKNTKIDVDSRINSIKKYMSKEASTQYRNSAKKIITMLENEKEGIVKKELLAKEQRKKEQARLAKIKEEEERIKSEKKRIASTLKRIGKGRYTVNNNGTVSDMETGLLWNILDTHIELKKCLTYSEAKAYVEKMKTGGYDDWRLPTTHDLLMILNTQPGFPETGAKWYWTSESYVKGFHEIANIAERNTGVVWKKGESKLTECGTVRAVRP